MLGCFYTLVDDRTECKMRQRASEYPIKDVMHPSNGPDGDAQTIRGPEWRLPAASSLQCRRRLDRTRPRHHTFRPPRWLEVGPGVRSTATKDCTGCSFVPPLDPAGDVREIQPGEAKPLDRRRVHLGP